MKSIRGHHIVTETEVVDGWLTIDDEGRIAAIGGTLLEKGLRGGLGTDWLFTGLIRSPSAWLYGLERIKTTDETRFSTWLTHCCGQASAAFVPSCISYFG